MLDRNKVLPTLKTKLQNIWQTEWENNSHGRTTFAFIKNVQFSKENAWFSPEIKTGFLLTGHGSFNSYLKDRNLVNDASCVACGEPSEDWAHMLYECPLYADLRWEHMASHSIRTLDTVRLNSSSLIQNETAYVGLTGFARDAFLLREVTMARPNRARGD